VAGVASLVGTLHSRAGVVASGRITSLGGLLWRAGGQRFGVASLRPLFNTAAHFPAPRRQLAGRQSSLVWPWHGRLPITGRSTRTPRCVAPRSGARSWAPVIFNVSAHCKMIHGARSEVTAGGVGRAPAPWLWALHRPRRAASAVADLSGDYHLRMTQGTSSNELAVAAHPASATLVLGAQASNARGAAKVHAFAFAAAELARRVRAVVRNARAAVVRAFLGQGALWRACLVGFGKSAASANKSQSRFAAAPRRSVVAGYVRR
jgi:hypothetical protein